METKVCTKCKIELPKDNFYPDKRKKQQVRDYCKKCKAQESAKYRKEQHANFLITKKASRLRKAGCNVTNVALKNMFNKHDGLCDICGKPEQYGRNKELAIDHCHKTAKIRGLLCIKCNMMLGLSHDSVDILSSAVEYLKKNQA